nr:hypothetical protein CFP56_18256 [Quercus suber]
MYEFKLCWLGSVSTEVGGFEWARLWVPMNGSAMGGYGSEVLVVKAFAIGSNVGVNDGDDEVEAKVEHFEEAKVASGFEAEELRGPSGVEVAESVGGKIVGLESRAMPALPALSSLKGYVVVGLPRLLIVVLLAFPKD